MELPVMKNFLCCLPLESGGRVIGWTMKIYGCFITLAMIATIIVMTNKLINNVVTDEDGNYLDSTDATDISIGKIVLQESLRKLNFLSFLILAILVLSIVFAHSLVTYVVATKFLNALKHVSNV